MTWQFEEDVDYDEEDDPNYEWGFSGYVDYVEGVAVSVTGHFYCFEIDEDKEDRYIVRVRYEGKFIIKELD